MNPYIYESSPDSGEIQLKKETRHYLQYKVRLKNPLDIVHSENEVIPGDYYLPKSGENHPLMILVHGMGDYSRIPCSLLARKLVKQNIACFVPYLTIHSKRLPKAYKADMPYLTPQQWFEVYRISIVDIRRIIDWASGRDEIKPEKIYIAGISFGGFVSSISMGVDDRIKAGILIVTGGNANKISWLSESNQYRNKYPRSESEHNLVLEKYRRYLENVDKHGFDNVEAEDISFYSDPLTFAGVLRDRPVLMINAEKDKYLHKETVIELWEALGKPPIKWLPAGHVTIWFQYSSIYRAISEFLSGICL
ncbi:alpha/beta hydrolase family protein [Chloroflexota bacterium]